MNKRIARSLKMQLFFYTLVSLVLAAVSFCGSFAVGNAILDRTVYGRTFSVMMADRQFMNLQSYVHKEGISLDNLQRLNIWCSRGDKVYLTLYYEDIIVYESPVSGWSRTELDPEQYNPDMEDPGSEYILFLCDDLPVRTFLYYYAGDAFYFGIIVFSGLLSFAVFSFCFIFFIGRKIKYIKLLQTELDILSGGNLEYPVTITGSDELGELAVGIDQMRRSILNHQETEERIRLANSELITAMSHDLRTPLTSLLVYLEILEHEQYTDQRQMQKLIEKSVGQTMRIRQMADKLFNYFQMYATEWETADMEIAEAEPFFLQVLDEYADTLGTEGWCVVKEYAEVSGKIRIHPELIQRVLDNLTSNLRKYAAPDQSVLFSFEQRDDWFIFSISNKILTAFSETESTGIGLKTCRRILEFHGGTFTAVKTDDCFTVTLSMPLLY